MECKNSSTLNNILNAAKDEFFKKDYQNASLREISKKAGVTTGALYGYFKNKEELFDKLVGKQYNQLISDFKNLLIDFSNIPPQQQTDIMMDYCRDGASQFIEYMYANLDEFKLILCHSRGTKYENLVHDMARLDIKATHEFVRVSNEIGSDVKETDETIEHIIISGMFCAIFELVIHDVPKDKAIEYVKMLMEFYHAGWKKIMGF